MLTLARVCWLLIVVILATSTSSFSTNVGRPRASSSSTSLAAASSVDDESSPATQPKKVVYGIRHGISRMNEWMRSSPDNGWGAPTFCDDLRFVDSGLSEAGIRQAQAMAERLNDELNDESIELVVISPLTRAIETWQHGVLPVFSNVPVTALHHASERVLMASDTGRHVAILQEEFASLDDAIDWSPLLQHEEEQANRPWWYVPDSKDDNTRHAEFRPSGGTYVVPGEPQALFEQRMQRLEQWLHRRPEQTILLVTHKGVLRHLTGGQPVENCGLVRIELNPNKAEAEPSLFESMIAGLFG